MSNFQTFGAVTDGLEGSAPARFIACTTDSYAALLVPGYLNDKSKIVKANDVIDINYDDSSTFPLNVGEASLFASFSVQYDPSSGNWNLIPKSSTASGIAAYGVQSATYNYAGGSASFVVNDPAVTPNSVVVARLQSSANAVVVETVLPGNGSFTVTCSGNPGASVLEYIAILPSVLLQNQGLYAAQYSYVGGATTIVISNPSIVAGMVCQANFASQANASEIYSVIASAGALTIVCSANPGVSVIEYFAASPSSALSALGFYAAQYTNAGGSATTTISDSNITASSIVVADWASQANAAAIEKVTPGAGSLTILSSANPGASVLNYSATPSAEGAEPGNYVLLSGGQMTGTLYLAKGTATTTAGAATVNAQAGVLTTPSLTTAAAAAYSITLTNSQVNASSVVLLSLMGGTNTTEGLQLSGVPSAGSVAISLYNNNVAGSALNGTVIIGFAIF